MSNDELLQLTKEMHAMETRLLKSINQVRDTLNKSADCSMVT